MIIPQTQNLPLQTADLRSYTLPELLDLLVEHTSHLLYLMNKRGADGFIIRDKRIFVQKIQSAITSLKRGR